MAVEGSLVFYRYLVLYYVPYNTGSTGIDNRSAGATVKNGRDITRRGRGRRGRGQRGGGEEEAGPPTGGFLYVHLLPPAPYCNS